MSNPETDTQNSIYLISAWVPALVTLALLANILVHQSVDVLFGAWGAFYLGIIVMHMSVAITETTVWRFGGDSSAR